MQMYSTVITRGDNLNKKLKRIIAIPFLVIIFLWVIMVTTDYILSTKVITPIFAQSVNASDADIYRGIGYTIIIDDGYSVSPPQAELKGYFYWGK